MGKGELGGNGVSLTNACVEIIYSFRISVTFYSWPIFLMTEICMYCNRKPKKLLQLPFGLSDMVFPCYCALWDLKGNLNYIDIGDNSKYVSDIQASILCL